MVKRLPCWAYQTLFWFKQTRLAGWLFYATRQPFQVVTRNVTVVGTVLERPADQTDGDETFDIRPNPLGSAPIPPHPRLHCEITPCTRGALAAVLPQVIPNAIIQVTGDYCYDPPHFGDGEHFEIHPVRTIVVIAPAPTGSPPLAA